MTVNKLIFRSLISIFVLSGLFLVCANMFLRTGALQKLLNRRPEKMEIKWDSAWMLIPGHIHILNFHIRNHSGRIAWQADLNTVDVHLSLVKLLHRTLHVRSLSGAGLSVVISREENKKSARKQPTAHLRKKKKTTGWTIRLDKVSIQDIHNLKIMDYTIAGKGSITGEMRLVVRSEFSMRHAHLNFSNGTVSMNSREIARDWNLDCSAVLDSYVPSKTHGRDIWKYFSGRVELQCEDAGLGFMNYYFRQIPWLQVHGIGYLKGSVSVDHGKFTDGGKLDFSAEQLRCCLRDYDITGTGIVSFRTVKRDTQTISSVKVGFNEMEITGINRVEPLFHGASMQLTARAAEGNLRDGFSDMQVALDMTGGQVDHWELLNRYFPEKARIKILPEVRALFGLHLEIARNKGAGWLEVEGYDTGIRIQNTEARGNICFQLDIESEDPELKNIRITGARLGVEKLVLSGKRPVRVTDWDAEIQIEDGAVTVSEPIRMQSDIRFRMTDIDPVLALLSPPGNHRAWYWKFTELRDVRGACAFEMDDAGIALDDIRLSGRVTLGNLVRRGAGITLTGAHWRIGQPVGDMQMQFSFPKHTRLDLTALNAFFPKQSGIAFAPGSVGTLGLSFQVRNNSGYGKIHIRGKKIRAFLDALPIESDIDLGIRIHTSDLSRKRFNISKTKLRFNNLNIHSEHAVPVEKWWAEVAVGKGSVQFGKPLDISARIKVEMQDISPVISILTAGKHLDMNAWYIDFLNVRDISGTCRLRTQQDQMLLEDISVTGLAELKSLIRENAMALSIHSSEWNMQGKFRNPVLDFRLPESELVDLQVLNKYLPERSGVTIGAGSRGHISAAFHVQDNRGEGYLAIDGRNIDVGINEFQVNGNLSLNIAMKNTDLSKRVFSIAGTELNLDNVKLSTVENAPADPWWLKLKFIRGDVLLVKPLDLTGRVKINMKNTQPIVTVFAQKSKLVKWFRNVLNIQNIHGVSDVHTSAQMLAFHGMHLSGDDFELQSHIEFRDKKLRGILFVHFHLLSAGIEMNGEEREYHLIRPKKWYETQVETNWK